MKHELRFNHDKPRTSAHRTCLTERSQSLRRAFEVGITRDERNAIAKAKGRIERIKMLSRQVRQRERKD